LYQVSSLVRRSFLSPAPVCYYGFDVGEWRFYLRK
jgi:hypothetical protein